jgi:hypothetical protein
MKIDLKPWFCWLESTPWTETPLYPGRAQRPEDQAKYDAAMATRSGMSKTIYALLDWFGGLSKVVGFRWLESTPWTETPLYPGRSQKPEEQAKYDAAMVTKNGISKTIYALLDCFGALTKIYKIVGFRWAKGTPWTETPLSPGRSQKPEEQAKYDAGMPVKIPDWPKYCTVQTAEGCIARTKHAVLFQSRQIYEAAGYTQQGRQDELERIIKQEAKKMRKVAVIGCIAILVIAIMGGIGAAGNQNQIRDLAIKYYQSHLNASEDELSGDGYNAFLDANPGEEKKENDDMVYRLSHGHFTTGQSTGSIQDFVTPNDPEESPDSKSNQWINSFKNYYHQAQQKGTH